MNLSRIDALVLAQEGLTRVTRACIEQMQLQKLNALLAREKQRGGFYRDLPDHLESLSSLSALPFTLDEDLAQNAPGLLLCSQAEVQRVISDATSGTTGTAKRVFYTETDLENTVRLYMAGLGELVFPGSVTMICFPFSGPFGLGELIAEAIRRLGARPLKAGPFLSYEEYAELIARERPDTFVGMPVQLLGMLRFVGRGSLERALISGDACPDSVTEGCETILGTELFPHYGSREMGMAGAICCQAHAGMHLRENHIIAEIVDPTGKPLPAGEWGELVITTIGMEAMPLIRYRTGDCTRILPEPCPCGSEVKRLDRIERQSDGICMSALDEVLFADESIVDCRAELEGEKLTVTALAAGVPAEKVILSRLRTLYPELSVSFSARPALPSDRALYPGKRTLTRKEN